MAIPPKRKCFEATDRLFPTADPFVNISNLSFRRKYSSDSGVDSLKERIQGHSISLSHPLGKNWVPPDIFTFHFSVSKAAARKSQGSAYAKATIRRRPGAGGDVRRAFTAVYVPQTQLKRGLIGRWGGTGRRGRQISCP